MKSISIEDRIEYAAQCGAYEMSLFVWRNTAKKLVRGKLILEKTGKSARKGEAYYHISWKDATVPNLPEGTFSIDDVIEESRHAGNYLSYAQILWLNATEYNRRKNN